MHATDGIRRITLPRRGEHCWRLVEISLASIGLALGVGAFLLFRRLSGALHVPLPATPLVATATVLLMWMFCVRAVLALHGMRSLALWLPAGTILLFAVACSYPGIRAVDWVLWLAAIGALVLSHRLARIAGLPRSPGTTERGSPTGETEARFDQVVQQLTRYRTAAGQDVIRGTLTAQFSPGERTTTLYVAFCPPFERLPDVEMEVAEDATASAKLAQLLHNGMQLEVRLAKAALGPRTLPVEFFAAQPTHTA